MGEESTNGDFTLIIKTLVARAGSGFYVSRKSRSDTILSLQADIEASEKGKDSGIIDLRLQNKSPEYSKKVLDKVTHIYVKRNVDRNSAEAQKSLDFLELQLPEIKKQLEKSESLFNNYQINQKSVNVNLETSAILAQIVELDIKLQESDLMLLETSRLFKREHPSYQGLIKQIATVQEQRERLSQKVADLPETQQALLRLMRDVEVGNEIYTMLLGKVQELDIVRAGTLGNVRIIDAAEVNISSPVKPKKQLIVLLATLLGGFLAVAIVLIRIAFRQGITNPSEIENIGLSVYASVPFSAHQVKLIGVSKNNKIKQRPKLLALDNPADLSIEALRNLRTSLHFAMIEADNNLLIISGASPEVGKSFISANLAIILAQSGEKVLLVDGNMRKGSLHKLFNVAPEKGLSEFLSG